MDLLDLLKKINPNFLEFITQDIVDDGKNLLGVKCFGVDKDANVFAGGTGTTKDLAIRIAIAEAFERSLFLNLCKDTKLCEEFDIANFPTSSGFAVGFDEKSTRFRAICEGLERWVWSKWIDEHFIIPEEAPNESVLSPLTQHLLKSFDKTYWYKKEFSLNVSPNEKLKLSIVIFLGCAQGGIFPGSRVSTKADDLYQHPVIEAHRNLSNALLDKTQTFICRDIIQERTMFFAKNKEMALSQIACANQTDWPAPEIGLLRKLDTKSSQVFMYRCLLRNFVGWHLGPVERFVY